MDNKEDKRELILNTAEMLFEKYGYNKTSMEDIASEAFIGKGTIYYYFKTKEDIFLELAKHYHKKIFSQLNIELEKCKTFDEKFKLMIKLPISHAVKTYPVYYDALQTHTKSLLRKMCDFKNEKIGLYFDLMKSVLIEAQQNNEINEDLDVGKLISLLIRRFIIGDDNVNININKEVFEQGLKDHDIFIDIILYGIKKRS